MKKIVLVLAVLALVLAVGCSESRKGQAVTGGAILGIQEDITVEETVISGPVEVIIGGQSVEPSELRISKGTEVTWKKIDGKRHRVMENMGVFDSSEQLYEGKTYSYTFNRAMTYEYVDVLGGGVGRIIVE